VQAQQPVLVEVWSDVVCPWCYIGKRRLEEAVHRLDGVVPARVVWRSFQLDPSAPGHSEADPSRTHVQHLAEKYGAGPDGAQQMIDRVTAVAASVGLDFHLERGHPASTLDAHRLLHEAARHGDGVQEELKERLLRAYFTDGEAVEDPDVLLRHATAAGVPEADARRVLAGREHADAVRRDQAEAAALGASGVPFAVVDRRYGIAGAQPAELFEQALRQAWADRAPVQLLDLPGVTPSDADEHAAATCGPDGCDPR